MLFASFDRVSIRDGLPTVLFLFIFCFSFIRLSIVLPVCFACGSVGGGGGGGSGGSFGGCAYNLFVPCGLARKS